jgi:hypothetical protein
LGRNLGKQPDLPPQGVLRRNIYRNPACAVSGEQGHLRLPPPIPPLMPPPILPLMPPPMPPPTLPLMPLKPREDSPDPEEIPVDPPRLGRLITPLPLNDTPDPLLVLTEGANAPSPRELLKERTFRNWPMRLPPLGVPSNRAPLPLNPSPLVMILALLPSDLMASRPIPVTTPELVRLMPMVPRPLPMLPRLILPSVGPRLRFRTVPGSPLRVRPLVALRPVTAPLVSLRSLTTPVSLKSLSPLISLV